MPEPIGPSQLFPMTSEERLLLQELIRDFNPQVAKDFGDGQPRQVHYPVNLSLSETVCRAFCRSYLAAGWDNVFFYVDKGPGCTAKAKTYVMFSLAPAIGEARTERQQRPLDLSLEVSLAPPEDIIIKCIKSSTGQKTIVEAVRKGRRDGELDR